MTRNPRIKLLSRHPTHRAIRHLLPRFPYPVVVRLGSLTEVPDVKVQLNSTLGVRNSSDKLLMKQCFDSQQVKTAKWWTGDKVKEMTPAQRVKELKFPLIAKARMGSRGTGVYKLPDLAALDKFLTDKGAERYIFEKYQPYTYEYRMHVWEDGCFYACRKARKRGLPEDQKWKFNYEHTVWLREDNPNFNKPACWDAMDAECRKAVAACGLTFGGCDVKVNKDGTKFFILEINSAPSFGDLTSQKYIEMLPLMAKREYEKLQANAT